MLVNLNYCMFVGLRTWGSPRQLPVRPKLTNVDCLSFSISMSFLSIVNHVTHASELRKTNIRVRSEEIQDWYSDILWIGNMSRTPSSLLSRKCLSRAHMPNNPKHIWQYTLLHFLPYSALRAQPKARLDGTNLWLCAGAFTDATKHICAYGTLASFQKPS